MDPVKNTCPCGEEHDVYWRSVEYKHGTEHEYDVFDIECQKCGRKANGGNYKTGEITSWITARDAAIAEAEYQRQLLEADMNEWYGRGEW